MSIVIPELVLIRIINVINKHYWDDYQANLADPTKSLLYNMFGGLEIDEFKYFDSIIEVMENHFEENQKPMTVSLGWSPERNIYPSVCLLLPSEEVIAEGVNVILTQEITNVDTGKYRDIKRYPYAVTYALLISSDNANEVMLLYHYYKTALIAGIEQLELSDFGKIRISGKDHTMQMDILPQQAHHRTVDISFMYTNKVWGLIEKDVVTGIEFEGDPVVTDPTACLPGTVKNFDGTYEDEVASGGLLILPNVIHIDSDGAPVELPAITPMVCTSAAGSLDVFVNSVLFFNDVTTDQDVPVQNTLNEPKGFYDAGVWRLPNTEIDVYVDDVLVDSFMVVTLDDAAEIIIDLL